MKLLKSKFTLFFAVTISFCASANTAGPLPPPFDEHLLSANWTDGRSLSKIKLNQLDSGNWQIDGNIHYDSIGWLHFVGDISRDIDNIWSGMAYIRVVYGNQITCHFEMPIRRWDSYSSSENETSIRLELDTQMIPLEISHPRCPIQSRDFTHSLNTLHREEMSDIDTNN